jgi:hypothetical protein
LTKSDTVSFGKKRLHLRKVSAKDNGVYRCAARNEAGSRNSADNFSLAIAGELILYSAYYMYIYIYIYIYICMYVYVDRVNPMENMCA